MSKQLERAPVIPPKGDRGPWGLWGHRGAEDYLRGRIADLWKHAKSLKEAAPEGIFRQLETQKYLTDNPPYPADLDHIDSELDLLERKLKETSSPADH